MFTKPEKNILQFGLTDGMRVADLGCGSGFYTRVASEIVGYSGKVYAVDIQKDVVKKLEGDLDFWKLNNVECVWGDIEKLNGTKLGDHTIDAVIVSNVLSQIEDIEGLIFECIRILKIGGKLLLVDWNKSSNIFTVPDETLEKDIVQALFEKNGFNFIKDISTSDHHYGIIFKYE